MRKANMDLLAKEKEQKVIQMFKKLANNNVKDIKNSEDSIMNLADRIKAGFTKDESV